MLEGSIVGNSVMVIEHVCICGSEVLKYSLCICVIWCDIIVCMVVGKYDECAVSVHIDV